MAKRSANFKGHAAIAARLNAKKKVTKRVARKSSDITSTHSRTNYTTTHACVCMHGTFDILIYIMLWSETRVIIPSKDFDYC